MEVRSVGNTKGAGDHIKMHHVVVPACRCPNIGASSISEDASTEYFAAFGEIEWV